MQFPHLEKSNAWPGLDTVAPFDLQVEFDPSVWGPDVEIHLCKTRLDAEYRNIGGWKTAAERDAWFESHSDRSFRLDSEFHVLPGTEIKLPVAFEVLQHYNQIYIDFPRTDTEYGNPSVTRYYYFVTDVTYRSPSSTGCIVTVDEWSTHMFDIDMRYIDLERGHAPMAEVSVASYLANPMDNSELLTVPDEVGSGTARIRYTAEHVINSGPHYLVISMTADPEQSPGTIHDTSSWRVPVTLRQNSQGGFCTPSVFAIAPSDANILLERMNAQAPQLMPTIQAVFLVPVRLLETAYNFQLLGVTCYHIEPKQRLDNFLDITQDKFGYPSRYRDIAKLYTSPYSWIELTDEQGRTQTIAVEETTGRLRVSTIASILAPFLGIDLYVTGIGTSAEDSITWDNMYDHTFRAYGNWTRGLRTWNIPSYCVMQDAETSYNWTTYWQRQQAMATNEQGYNLAIATNNLNYNMRNAALDRDAARIRQQQEHDNKQITLAQNTATYQNAANLDKAVGDCLEDVKFMELSSDLTSSEVGMSWSTAKASSSSQLEQQRLSVGQARNYTDYVNGMGMLDNAQSVLNFASSTVSSIGGLGSGISDKKALELGSVEAAYQALGPTSTLAVGANTIATGIDIISGGLGVYQQFQSAGYNSEVAAAAAQMSQIQLQGAAVQAQQVDATYALMMANNQILRSETRNYMIRKLNNATEQTNRTLELQKNQQSQSAALSQQYQRNMSDGDIALTRSQMGAAKGMSDRSATERKALQDQSLENSRRAARIASPRVYAQPTGSMANYTRPQVLMARVVTRDPGSIATAGDAFLRYGYRLGGRQWTVSTLTPMSHFSYWEGDAMIASDSITEVSRGILKGIFSAGTHIWRNPSEIGSISIYENRGDL